MDRETFDRILVEEGLDDPKMRDHIWNSRGHPGVLDEEHLRNAAKRFKQALPMLRLRKALKAMARKYGRNK